MTGKERIQTILNHKEADRVPYDLAGTTVTAITKNAYVNAMKARGLSPEYEKDEIDPISQIVMPVEENLLKLNSDTRRIGALRIPEYLKRREIDENGIMRVTDFYGCDWELNPAKDIYYNQVTYPLKQYATTMEGTEHIHRVNWNNYVGIMQNDLFVQIERVKNNCCIADRNTAGFTENSLRVRGYEEWYLDTMMDYQGVDRLLHIILEDKIRYWDALIDWAIEKRVEKQIQVISESDDLGSQEATIMDHDTLRLLVIPKIKTLFTHIKKRLPHVRIFMHSCGAIRPILPDLIDAGLDILNPVQFTAVGMELKGLKKDFGDVLTFWGGGIDTQSTLNNGTVQNVKDEVKKVIDILAPGGGFVFAPVHNIQDDVSPENFWAMWDTLQEYGNY
uniref:uroporphyrinogen decarboxylase family protein n=1 Tax=uncultured Draconibacterium sp. TaxID=1573823 RepID=UPI0032168958